MPFRVWIYHTVLNFLWPPLNYYRLHMLYITTCAVVGLFFPLALIIIMLYCYALLLCFIIFS